MLELRFKTLHRALALVAIFQRVVSRFALNIWKSYLPFEHNANNGRTELLQL